MESIGAINLLYLLLTTPAPFPDGVLPVWHKVVAALYVLHYLNRAVITPLFCAPSMSPIHLVVVVMASLFNFINSSCLAGWLLGYGTPLVGFTVPPTSQSAHFYFSPAYLPYVGLVIFLVGMCGNIHAEAIVAPVHVTAHPVFPRESLSEGLGERGRRVGGPDVDSR